MGQQLLNVVRRARPSLPVHTCQEMAVASYFVNPPEQRFVDPPGQIADMLIPTITLLPLPLPLAEMPSPPPPLPTSLSPPTATSQPCPLPPPILLSFPKLSSRTGPAFNLRPAQTIPEKQCQLNPLSEPPVVDQPKNKPKTSPHLSTSPAQGLSASTIQALRTKLRKL